MPLTLVDVETTRDRVVEIAMLRFQKGCEPWVFHSYLDPGHDGWARSARYWNTEIHGLTQRIVHGKPTFALIAHTVTAALDGSTMVAHNVSFEARFLQSELARTGGGYQARQLCTLRLARHLLPDRASCRLDALAIAHDVRNPAPHRALGDTFTTLWVMLAMLETLTAAVGASAVAEAMRANTGGRLNPWQGPLRR
jgi:DNA polymerase III subunit epsilon